MRRAVKVVSIAIFLCAMAVLGRTQTSSTGATPVSDVKNPAETFYLKLRSVGLNKSQVYKIREASLDRGKVHISLDDGTIAFTEAVDGHITGAFYQGYGEVLLMPPNQAERASMSLFTGSAILEETFSSAYFRFNDDVFSELQPYLRQAEDPAGFAAQWEMTARNLAASDALRLLLSFGESVPGAKGPPAPPTDRMLHAYVEGNKLGGFDVLYDSLLLEQISAGQHKHVGGEDYYDVWASFAVPAPLTKGQKVQFIFEYSGSVLSEAANGLLYVGEHGTWYPNRGFAMAAFDLEFHYPPGWTLVATGHRAQLNTSGGEQVSKWVTERPVPVAGSNLGKYSQTVSHAGKVAITTYATANVERGFQGTGDIADSIIPVMPDTRIATARLHPFPAITPAPPSPAVNAQAVGAASAKAIEFYEHQFGPYPYGELAITQMPGIVSQGWPGLIFLSTYSFLTTEEKTKLQSDPVRRLLSDQVIAHETAHQWWGDLVKWNSYRDQWMMEALANYSALMLLESRDPAKFQRIMQSYRDILLAKGPNGIALMDAGPVTLGFRISSSQFPDAYEPVCYGRGTWLFHMLRTMMRDTERKSSPRTNGSRQTGDELFVRALRKIRKEYEDKAVSTSQLMHIFESELPASLEYEGHKSLDWFYEGWINGTAIPSFELRDVKFTENNKTNTTLVTGTIVQQHAPDTLVTPVPLYASTGVKNIFLKRIFAEGKRTH